jgi:VWFA-related protein
MVQTSQLKYLFVILSLLHISIAISAQSLSREINVPAQVSVEIRNGNGRVYLTAVEEQHKRISIKAEAPGGSVKESDLNISSSDDKVKIGINGEKENNRIDLYIYVPERTDVHIVSDSGAVDVVGKLREATVDTNTGTIRADVPVEALSYNFLWTASRPRYFSSLELGKVSEKAGGKYKMEGRLGDKKADKREQIHLNLTTQRGVILFGVDQKMVPSDLQERELTKAAKAIAKSGDPVLVEAISKVSPKLFRDYIQTLPNHKGPEPTLISHRKLNSPVDLNSNRLFRFNAHVTDRLGRAISGLTARDFNIFERGEKRTITEVVPTTAPFNLVLLLDLSGSVEERFDFIRKAALAFVDAASPQDNIAITSFRNDIQVISEFTSDHRLLKERIGQMEVGGATALYDALAYTLVHTLKPIRGERTAIIILSDGDDNKSFLPFPALLDIITESGALIYPLYIPSALIPSSRVSKETSDPTRSKYLTLTTEAEEQGRQLAKESGGIYYPIARLEEVKMAFDDVIKQLRSSYTVTYESKSTGEITDRGLRVSVVREGVSIHLSPVVSIKGHQQ